MNLNKLNFDKEFQEKLNIVNIAAHRYFKIKVEYERTLEELQLLLGKQKSQNERIKI